MDIIQIVIVLIILGIAFWVLQTYVLPAVADPFKTIIMVVLAIAVILWLLSLIGFGHGLHLRS